MNRSEISSGWTAVATGAALGFCLLPFGYMLLVATSQSPHFLAPAETYRWTTEHLQRVLTDDTLNFMAYLRNSCVVALLSSALAVTAATLAAYACTRIPFRGRIPLLILVLAASMFPQASLAGYLFKFMHRLGWINTYAALVPPYAAWVLPLATWILVSYFARIPPELDEAAEIDGCGRLQTLLHVLLPVAGPGVFSVFLLTFIFSFNEFMFALLLTTDAASRTVPVGVALFQGLHGQTPWGTIMAASVVTSLPLVAVTILFHRQLISGLTRGAVKG